MRKLIKPIIYVISLMMLGTSIAIMKNTNLGMASWDALSTNFYEGIHVMYTVFSLILSILLISFAYLISWKKPDFKMIIPVVISTIIGFAIDLALLFVPNVSEMHIIINYLYLFLAMILISIALNVIIYCGYTLPALEQFTMAISNRLKISFGKAKLLGELIAFILSIIFGLIFNHQSEFFFIGQTTIIVLLFIGLTVDLLQKPTFKLLGRIIWF